MTKKTQEITTEELLSEIERLRVRLEEAEETLRAIGSGEVDAFVVSGANGEQIFTLKGAEHPYRVLVETMNEGAATLTADGTILYCNNRLATLLQRPLERVIGTPLSSYVAPADQLLITARLGKRLTECDKEEVNLITGNGNTVPVLISCCPLDLFDNQGLSVVVTDLTQQKRNEEFLASARLVRSIIEQAGEAIIVCDDSGRIINASLLAHRLCGKNPLLHHFDEMYQFRMAESGALVSVLQSVARETFRNVDVTHKRGERGVSHLILNAAPLKSHQGKTLGCVVTLTDITERKLAEKALQESEGQFRALADSIPNLAWRANGDGSITWFNQRWYEYTGTTSAQMEGWGWQSVHDPVELPKVLERWQASIVHGEPFEMIFPLLGADGVFRPFLTRGIPLKDASGRVQQWFGTNTDISELKRLEQVLRENEERLGMVLQASSMGIFEVNLETGEGRWNDIEYELLGLKPGGAPGNPKNFFQYVHPDDIEALKAKWEDALQFGELDAEFRIVRADGQEGWLAGKGGFLSDGKESNQALRFLGVNFDITKRKLAEERIKASLAEKEVLLKEIHHRVKNNLQIISSLVSMQADNLTDQRTREEFSEVCDRVRSMALIHEKLYQTSDLAQLNFADYATGLLEYLWDAHNVLAEKVLLQLELAPVVLLIESAVPCGLILNELVGNALKHAFPNDRDGEVTVALEHDPTTETACLRVCDNGVGLPPDMNWRQSSSLGLQLVQILADQLRGTVETGTGPGAEFSVTFPLTKKYSLPSPRKQLA
jgi:PAS domain S-box-containing protein